MSARAGTPFYFFNKRHLSSDTMRVLKITMGVLENNTGVLKIPRDGTKQMFILISRAHVYARTLLCLFKNQVTLTTLTPPTRNDIVGGVRVVRVTCFFVTPVIRAGAKETLTRRRCRQDRDTSRGISYSPRPIHRRNVPASYRHQTTPSRQYPSSF